MRPASTHLHIPANEARPDGIAFLAHRGFTEYDRAKAVRLDLRGLPIPTVEAPAGIAITTLADDPELVPGVHAVALEAFEDIPGGDQPMDVGDLAEFRARDVDRAEIPADAFTIARDEADGSVVGYAVLSMVPGSDIAAWHDMTAVRRAYRGRGIARSLKLGDDRLGDRAWTRDARHWQRRGQRLDAGPQRATRVSTVAGRAHDARSGRRRHH